MCKCKMIYHDVALPQLLFIGCHRGWDARLTSVIYDLTANTPVLIRAINDGTLPIIQHQGLIEADISRPAEKATDTLPEVADLCVITRMRPSRRCHLASGSSDEGLIF